MSTSHQIVAEPTYQNTEYVYGLTDPRTNKVCYVGKAVDPEKRLKSHLGVLQRNVWGMRENGRVSFKRNAKNAWLYELYQLGLEPSLTILAEADRSEIFALEAEYINLFGSHGNITNTALMGLHPKTLREHNTLRLAPLEPIAIEPTETVAEPYGDGLNREFYKIEQVAEFLELSNLEVREQIKSGAIRAIRVAGYRIAREEVRRLLAERVVQA